MKAYVATTGTLFALIVVAHLLRILEEGTHLARDPWYLLLTLAAAAVAAWAGWLLFRRSPR